MLNIAERYAIHLIASGEIDVAYAFLTQMKSIAGGGSLKFATKEVSLDFFFRKQRRFRALIQAVGATCFSQAVQLFGEYWMTEVLRDANMKLKKDICLKKTYETALAQEPGQEAAVALERIKKRRSTKETLGDL